MRTNSFRYTLLLCIAASASTLFAQDSSKTPAHSADCKIDTTMPGDADIALRHDPKKAESLFAAILAKNPADSRSQELEIDAIIAQGRVDEAQKKTDEWTKASPTDKYAILTAADVRFAEGDWPESYALALKTLKLDPCFGPAYANLADFESVAGYRETARRHRVLAHQLEPNNIDFREQWISTLDLPQQIDETKAFIQDPKIFNDKQRKAMEDVIARAAAQSENRCELTAANGPARIPMTPIYGPMGPKTYGLEIAFNRHKRILEIDTGASGFTLTHSAGANMGLPNAGKGKIGGFGEDGASTIDLDVAKSVQIGGLEFQNCPVEVLAVSGVLGGDTQMGDRMDDIDGIVGSNIFDRYLVTLDYIKHEVRLDPLPDLPGPPPAANNVDKLHGSNDPYRNRIDRYIAPSMATWTKVYRRGHQLIIPTRINQSNTKLFMIDTGNFTNLIDTNTAKQITKADSGIYGMRGLSGSQEMSEAGKFTLDFAGIRLPVESMDSIDLTNFGGVTGFLGYPTLSQLVLHIDYRDNLVTFDAPNAKAISAPPKPR